MKAMLLAGLVAVVASQAFCNVQFVRSPERTSADLPIDFTLEKTHYDGKDLAIWGFVRNTSGAAYQAVKVVFTAKDSRGNLVTRTTHFARPMEIGPGKVGYFERDWIMCNGVKPQRVEYSVQGMK